MKINTALNPKQKHYSFCDIAVDTLSTLGSLFSFTSSLADHLGVLGARRLSGYKPFCCLAFGLAAEHSSPLVGGGEQEFISIPPLCSIPANTLIPSFGLIGCPPRHLFFSSAIPPTLELYVK
jgi:hypothetical protein